MQTADKAAMARRLRDGRFYIESFLRIRTKESKLERFILNPAQVRLYETIEKLRAEGKPVRVIILKARQMGFSTLTEGLIFHRAATGKNVNALIVAHREDSTGNLFKMSKRFLENLPEVLRPMTRSSNAQEILFENPDKNLERKALNPGLMSRIRCQTAGGTGIGRSDTIQLVHASEFAFWPGEKRATWAGIMQAVPDTPESMVIIESTANGYDEFHAMWEAAVKGENDFTPMFFPWYEFPSYRRKPDPGTEWTAGERELQERYGLDEEQLAWRRWCIRNNCAGDIQLFKQEYPSYAEEAFLTSGQAVFDRELIQRRIQEAPEPVKVGEFRYEVGADPTVLKKIRWVERENGCIRIYAEPVKGRPYVLGGDTAGTGSDYFTGQVLDNITGKQVAVLRHQYDEDQYARQMYCLGLYYNTALIGIEVNYSTYPVKMLGLMGYPKQYVREIPDTFTGGTKNAFGWNTTSKTRPLAIAELVQLFREGPEMVLDRETLKEMQVFQYNDDHRPEALAGEHDDLVMALAIAVQIRRQQDMVLPERERSTKHWTEDMWEDYYAADEATRRYLMEEWGG